MESSRLLVCSVIELGLTGTSALSKKARFYEIPAVSTHTLRFLRDSPWLRFYRDVKVDELLGEARELVRETKGVFANGVCGEDVVSLPLALALD
jgi:hypothetical protein